MNLSPHFTLAEFTSSDTAKRLHINNDLPIERLEVARNTAAMMERIRSYLSEKHAQPVPILITSGYRSPDLNRAIGSGPGSDHIKGLAVDFKAPAFGTPVQVCKALAPMFALLGLGQLIH